jgi:aspartate kinase
VNLLERMAMISLVGKQIKKSFGIAGKLFTSLAEADIPVDIISQSISGINISCAVQDKDVQDALNTIHEKIMDVDPSLFALCVQQQTL